MTTPARTTTAETTHKATLSWTELWAGPADPTHHPIDTELRALGLHEAYPDLYVSGTARIAVRRDLDTAGSTFIDRHGPSVGCIWLAGVDHAAAVAAFERAGHTTTTHTHPVTGHLRPAVAVFDDVLLAFETEHDTRSGQDINLSYGPETATELVTAVDHFAICLPRGELDTTCQLLVDALGLLETFAAEIKVGGQSMVSQVVQSPDHTFTLTVIEPGPGTPGQIDTYLERNGGAGVQHIALAVSDAITAVDHATEQGIHFLATPPAYYAHLPKDLQLRHTVPDLAERGLLVDTDPHGVLYQVFTESRHPRRTLFYEVIERDGARTFGTGNIRALYEAVEHEEAA